MWFISLSKSLKQTQGWKRKIKPGKLHLKFKIIQRRSNETSLVLTSAISGQGDWTHRPPEQLLNRRCFSLVEVDGSNPLISLLIPWTKSLPNQAEVNIFAPKGSMSHQHCCCFASLNTQTFCFFGQISVQKEDFYRDSLESSLSILSRQNKHRWFSQPSDSVCGHKAAGSRLSEKVGGKCRTRKSKLISLIGNVSLTFENVYGWIEWRLYFKKESDASESC